MGSYSAKVLITTVGNFIVTMVIALWRHRTYNLSGPCSLRIISEVLPKSHAMKKCDFLKSITHCQII